MKNWGTTENERKSYTLGELMYHGNPLVKVDLSVEGVHAPEGYDDGAGHIWLHVGHSMATPMQDFRVDDDGFGCVLSFRGMPRKVWVPWAAVVYMCGNACGYAWASAKPVVLPTPTAPADNAIHVDFKARKRIGAK